MLTLLGLREGHRGTPWSLQLHEIYDPPAALSNLSPFSLLNFKAYTNNVIAVIQNEFDFVVGGSPKNETHTSCLLNNILVCCVAEEKRLAQSVSSTTSSRDPPVSLRPATPLPEPAHLILRFETELKYPVIYKKETRMLNGIADYTLWYDGDESMGTNLVVVEAKRSGWIAQATGQVIAYMGESYFCKVVYLSLF